MGTSQICWDPARSGLGLAKICDHSRLMLINTKGIRKTCICESLCWPNVPVATRRFVRHAVKGSLQRHLQK